MGPNNVTGLDVSRDVWDQVLLVTVSGISVMMPHIIGYERSSSYSSDLKWQLLTGEIFYSTYEVRSIFPISKFIETQLVKDLHHLK